MKDLFYFTKVFLLLVTSCILGERYLDPSGSGPTYYGSPVEKGSDNIAHWSISTVSYYLHSNGAGDGLTFSQTQSLIEAAYNAWEDVETSSIIFNSKGSTNRTYAYDGYNVHYWDEAEENGLFIGALSGATAVTIVTVNSNNELLDVDIVYNGIKLWVDNTYN